MEVVFDDARLQRLYVDGGFRVPQFGPELTKDFRKLIGLIRAATDERDLRNMKSRHFEKLKGPRKGQISLRLYQQSRLIIKMQGANGKVEVHVIEITDYH